MIVLLPVIFENYPKMLHPNHTRGKEGLYNTMELLDVLDVIDTEKCRKMGIIRVESA